MSHFFFMPLSTTLKLTTAAQRATKLTVLIVVIVYTEEAEVDGWVKHRTLRRQTAVLFPQKTTSLTLIALRMYPDLF